MKKKQYKKFIKKVKKRIPWIEHLITNEGVAGDLNLEGVRVKVRKGSICIICRGSRLLCGRTRCPSILKMNSLLKVDSSIRDEQLHGSSPPAVFVGSMGYPNVYAGPLVPPLTGDTSILDFPEGWIGKTIDEIIDFRTKLVRGKFRVNVKRPEKAGRMIDETLELALSGRPVDAEVIFKKKPSGRVLFDSETQPVGPSGIIRKMSIGTSKIDRNIEKAYGDEDLKAEEALIKLYIEGTPISKIQRAFSIGAFGIKKDRRIVPTRWSITAVDPIISRWLIEERVKRNPPINEYRIYEFEYLGNRFIILLMPSNWSYEWIEAWYPGTAWNPGCDSVALGGDWEGYRGRKTYASIGGCYYAVRLAVAEHLAFQRRQATVLAMREIHPGYLTPLGVWINRECVRQALKREPLKYNNIEEALSYIGSKFTVNINEWIDTSRILKDTLYQEKITKYL